jgi:2-polyprenyl-3-methyl-5-hydroxy-6-metoxy-1,4-benzoquinol methylase
MWDQRYSGADYVYGTQPNDFLRETRPQLPAGKLLSLAEGEGRNAVWLAQQGYDVTAVDASSVGLAKARRLAESQGVRVNWVHADLAAFDIGQQHWDVIVSIFCHLPAALRTSLHQACVAGLRPGGMFLLEAYTPRQLAFATGGPPTAELMMDSQTLRTELDGLQFVHLLETEREIHEGQLHHGMGAVVQLLAARPASPPD